MDNTWPIKQTPMRSHPASQVGGQKVMVCYFQGILETVFLSEGTDSLPVNLPKSMYIQLHVTSSFLGWYPMGPLKPQLATMHGQSSLVGYSPWGYKESDTIEPQHTHTRSNNPQTNTVNKTLANPSPAKPAELPERGWKTDSTPKKAQPPAACKLKRKWWNISGKVSPQ